MSTMTTTDNWTEIKAACEAALPPEVVAFIEQNRGMAHSESQLIATLHKIRAIHNGELPVHPLNAPCVRCRHMEKCESTRGHRLSELL